MRTLLVVILPLLLVSCSSLESGSWQNKDASKDAYTISKDFVNERLLNAETAVYPTMGWNDKASVERDGESQRYMVTAYVDAEDSFGTMVRTEFTADVEQTSKGEWLLHDLQLRDQ